MRHHAIFDHALDRLGAIQMTVNGLHCTFNMPHALEARYDHEGNEIDQNLPPYGQRTAFSVDEFGKACPQNWMRGDPKSGSYFVPVEPDHGLWLDFNANRDHTHHVAVRISIQGVCAVTGLPTEGRLHLEQYRTRCPKHDIELGAERFCKECGFKWPDQNYLATTGTREGLFWLDGFRAKDGCTRQFVFTEEEMRGVAKQIIGEKRVFAIGLAFYLSKEPKPQPKYPTYACRRAAFGGVKSLSGSGPAFKGGVVSHPPHHFDLLHASAPAEEGLEGIEETGGGLMCIEEEHLDAPYTPATEGPPGLTDKVCFLGGPEETMLVAPESSASHHTPTPAIQSTPRPRPKHLEIAAGARIDQPIFRDPSDLAFWQDEPAAIIYINYCDEATARAILSQGKEDRTAHGEGFMDGLVVGHPVHPGQ